MSAYGPARKVPARLRVQHSAFSGGYIPGVSFLHKAPLYITFTVLIVLSSYLTVRGTSLTAAAVFCGVFVVHVGARLSFRIFIHVGWLALGISPFIGYLAVTASVSFALSRFLTFCALFYLALIFSSVTSPTSVFNAVSTVLRRWLGPRRALHVALACALMLRLLPQVNEALRISREAARSRGLHTRGWNAFVPSALRSVQQAIHVGEAVDARGLLSYDNTHR